MRKLSFWGAVAGVSILSNFALTALARKGSSTGLARFAAYAHGGNS